MVNYSKLVYFSEAIAGFRNILVHNYLEGIDCDIIWIVTQQELPKLQQAILEMKANITRPNQQKS